MTTKYPEPEKLATELATRATGAHFATLSWNEEPKWLRLQIETDVQAFALKTINGVKGCEERLLEAMIRSLIVAAAKRYEMLDAIAQASGRTVHPNEPG